MIRKYLLLFILSCHFSVFSMDDNNYILPRNFSEPDLVAASREPEYELHQSPSVPNFQSLQNLNQQPEADTRSTETNLNNTDAQPNNEHELPQALSVPNLQQPESETLDSSREADHSDSEEEEARLRAENRRRKGKEPAHNDEAGPSRRESGSSNSETHKAEETDLDPDSLKLQKFLAHETLRYTSKINAVDTGLCDIVLKYSPSEVQELLDTINDTERFEINNPDEIKLVSALFYGPSGSGKTTLAKVIATKTNSLGIRIDCTKVGSTYQSSTELNIDTAINEATKNGCLCVILLDEIDNLIPLNAINENIDTGGIKSLSQCIEKHYNNPNLILIGTTNYFGRLPNSITDRMPFLIELTLPNKKYRQEIINYFLKKMGTNKVNLDSCLQDTVLKYLAKNTNFFSIRDIEYLVNKAAKEAHYRFTKENNPKNQYKWFFIAIKKNGEKIHENDLYEALKKIQDRPDVKKRIEEYKNQTSSVIQTIWEPIAQVSYVAIPICGLILTIYLAKNSENLTREIHKDSKESSSSSLIQKIANGTIQVLSTVAGCGYVAIKVYNLIYGKPQPPEPK